MSRGLVCYFSVLCLVLGVRSQSLISSSVSSAVTHVAVSSNGVFVSTSNELYRFSPSLQQLGDPIGSLGGTVNGLASTVDGEWCVVCTDTGGVTCSVYNGSNLAATPNRTVTNSGAASSLVVFTAGGNIFYTGSFVGGVIHYRQYGFAGSSLSRTTMAGQQTASSGFVRNFVSGFYAGGYAYYVAVDPPLSGNNRLIRIIRVCNDSIASGFNNQYELTLGCDGNNDFFSPTVLPVSVINEEMLLIAIKASSMVDICSYNLSKINSLMDAAYQSCVVNNTGMKNINWQSSVSCSGLSGSIVSCVTLGIIIHYASQQCSITDSRGGTPAPAVGVANSLSSTGLITNTTILNKLSAIVGVTVDNIDFIYFAFSANSKQYINKVSSHYNQ